MKKLFLTLTTFLSVIFFAQNKKTDLQELNLKGNIKSLREIDYTTKYNNGNIEKDNILGKENTLRFFNQEGYLTEKTFYTPQNQVELREVLAYTAGAYAQTIIFDENNKQTGKILPLYNSKGQEAETRFLDQNGDVISITALSYNKKGLLSEKSEFNADGSLLSKGVVKYNKEGKYLEQKLSDNERKTTNISSFHYTEAGNLDNVVYQELDNKKKQISKIIYYYNEKGDVQSVEYFDADNKKQGNVHYHFHYDEKGNWTTRICYLNGYPIEITEREISYY